jgi:nicotinamide riboside transporter PnuC
VILKDVLEWFATLSGITAALMISADLGRRITGWGFVLFAVQSIAWIAFAQMDDTDGLMMQNGVLFFVNLLGIYRYLIRKRPPGTAEAA